MIRLSSYLAILVSCAAAIFLSARRPESLVVHEWGTFTAIQDDAGQPLAGINIDDEPLPAFVHSLNPLRHGPVQPLQLSSKGVPRRFPEVTMRLETPVLYFHPVNPQATFSIDVDVAFRGGWLTEFYPQAEVVAPGLTDGPRRLAPDTVGTLAWKNLRVGSERSGPATDSPVWLAPRQVQASAVTATAGESERYLFYRGLANLNAPLRATIDRASNRLSVFAQLGDAASGDSSLAIGPMWLVRVRDDGSLAFRPLRARPVAGDVGQPIAETSIAFATADFDRENLGRLKADLQRGLVADGLYDDEAVAMVNTWQRAYFESPGLRIFALTPQAWTDHYLPLRLSRPAEVRRVMVARIELISPEQREVLAKLAKAEISSLDWLGKIAPSPAATRFYAGHTDFGDLGVAIPSDYQLYLKLGRFRDALLIAEQKSHPSPTLAKFIALHRIDVVGQAAQ